MKNSILKRKNIIVYLFLIIPLLWYVMFFIVPNINTFMLSFFKWDGLSPDKIFVGIKNYIRLFNSGVFLLTLKNTVLYTITLIIFQNSIGLLIAYFIYESNKIHNIFRTLFFLPAVFSSVSIGLIWSFIYDPNIGAINTVLRSINLDNLAQSWLSNPDTAIFAIVLIHIWALIGYAMVIYIAGLNNIPVELYEAAEVDGVNRLQGFMRITLPLLRPSLMVNFVIATINGFVVFDFVYIMTRGGVNHSSEVLATLLYREGFNYGNVGYASSISVLLIIVVLSVSILQTQIFKERF